MCDARAGASPSCITIPALVRVQRWQEVEFKSAMQINGMRPLDCCGKGRRKPRSDPPSHSTSRDLPPWSNNLHLHLHHRRTPIHLRPTSRHALSLQDVFFGGVGPGPTTTADPVGRRVSYPSLPVPPDERRSATFSATMAPA